MATYSTESETVVNEYWNSMSDNHNGFLCTYDNGETESIRKSVRKPLRLVSSSTSYATSDHSFSLQPKHLMLPEDSNDALPTRGCARRMGSNAITRGIADGDISDSEVTDSESDSDSDDDFDTVRGQNESSRRYSDMKEDQQRHSEAEVTGPEEEEILVCTEVSEPREEEKEGVHTEVETTDPREEEEEEGEEEKPEDNIATDYGGPDDPDFNSPTPPDGYGWEKEDRIHYRIFITVPETDSEESGIVQCHNNGESVATGLVVLYRGDGACFR